MRIVSIVCLLVGLSHGADMHAMEYMWRKYAEWRDKNIIDALQKDDGVRLYVKAQATIDPKMPIDADKAAKLSITRQLLRPQVSREVEKAYEMPWYVRTLSYVSPMESETGRVKRAYQNYKELFNSVFYPLGGSRLFASVNLKDREKIGNIEAAVDLALLPDTSISLSDFNSLVKDTNYLVNPIIQNPEYSNYKTSFEDFLSKVSIIQQSLQSQGLTWIERWHRNRVANRVKEYFKLN